MCTIVFWFAVVQLFLPIFSAQYAIRLTFIILEISLSSCTGHWTLLQRDYITVHVQVRISIPQCREIDDGNTVSQGCSGFVFPP